MLEAIEEDKHHESSLVKAAPERDVNEQEDKTTDDEAGQYKVDCEDFEVLRDEEDDVSDNTHSWTEMLSVSKPADWGDVRKSLGAQISLTDWGLTQHVEGRIKLSNVETGDDLHSWHPADSGEHVRALIVKPDKVNVRLVFPPASKSRVLLDLTMNLGGIPQLLLIPAPNSIL